MKLDSSVRTETKPSLLAFESLAWECPFLPDSAWLEHIPFAFFATELAAPRTIVELGTHHGASYFAFCHAVRQLGLNTSCFAVDTWEGDVQAGAIDQSEYEAVVRHNATKYASFSTLIRSTFEEARTQFADGSIDLLHIDGLHTYEAVSHDFRTWRAALSSRSVLLLHDTNVRQGDFGVRRLFDELSREYLSFEFPHCNGLGVVVTGKDSPFNGLISGLSTDDRSRLQRLFFSLGTRLTLQRQHDWFRAEALRNFDAYSKQVAHVGVLEKLTAAAELEGSSARLRHDDEVRRGADLIQNTLQRVLDDRGSASNEILAVMERSAEATRLTIEQVAVTASTTSSQFAHAATRFLETYSDDLRKAIGDSQRSAALLATTHESGRRLSRYLDVALQSIDKIDQSVETFDRAQPLPEGATKIESTGEQEFALATVGSNQAVDQAASVSELVSKLCDVGFRIQEMCTAICLKLEQKLSSASSSMDSQALSITALATDVSALQKSLNETKARGEAECLRSEELERSLSDRVAAIRNEADRTTSLHASLLNKATQMELSLSTANEALALTQRRNNELEGELFSVRNRLGHLTGLLDANGVKIGMGLSRLSARVMPASSRRGKALLLGATFVKTVASRGPRAAIDATKQYFADRRRLQSAIQIHAEPLASNVLMLATAQSQRATPQEYARWIALREPPVGGARAFTAREQASLPLISILLPVYKVDAAILRATIDAVVEQSYERWELCIAHGDADDTENWDLIRSFTAQDKRVKAKRLTENRGISSNTNACMEMVSGEFVALLDHDDTIAPWALSAMVAAIAQNPLADFLYSDKDCIDALGETRLNPLFKPCWSPEMMVSVNYLTHFNLMRAQLVRDCGEFRSETDGAQDWDIFFRVIARARQVLRVPGVMYHWRIIPSSTSTGLAAKPYAADGQTRAVSDALAAWGWAAHVERHNEVGFLVHWNDVSPVSVAVILTDLLEAETNVAIYRRLLAVKGLAVNEVLWVGPQQAPDALISAGVRVTSFADVAQLLAHVRAGQVSSDCLVHSHLTDFKESFGELATLFRWCRNHPHLGFVSPVIVTANDVVVEAGRVLGDSGRDYPLFSGEPLRSWGVFGGALWHRNVSFGSCYFTTFSTAAVKECLIGQASPVANLSELYRRLAVIGKRGLSLPSVRLSVSEEIAASEAMPCDVDTFEIDPYAHPEFVGVSPFRFRMANVDSTSSAVLKR